MKNAQRKQKDAKRKQDEITETEAKDKAALNNEELQKVSAAWGPYRGRDYIEWVDYPK